MKAINPFLNVKVTDTGKLLHLKQAFDNEEMTSTVVQILLETARAGNLFETRPTHRNEWKRYYFPGAGVDPSTQVVAFDMCPPFKPPQHILAIIEESCRSTSRARVLPSMGVDLRNAVLVMDSILGRFVNERDWLGVGGAFHDKYVMGYVALYRTPLEVTVGWHTDPSNECDVAAIFVFLGSSMVTVGKEEGEVQVDAGDMYIFCPTVDTHMVGIPLGGVERVAVLLRYYKLDAEEFT